MASKSIAFSRRSVLKATGAVGLGVAATLRREKGHDIDAACGQLRLRTERELASA